MGAYTRVFGEAMNKNLTQATGDLPSAMAEVLAGSAVAIDIETSGLDWRKDRIGTVQIYAPAVGTIILRPTSSTPGVLLALLADPATRKVFHHAPFDLTFLAQRWPIDATAVSCTKIASKILSPELNRTEHSLQALLRARLGIVVDKGPVRVSDWTTEALTNEQIEYAASDVRYLLDLYNDLRTGLVAAGRINLYESCCQYLPAQAALTVGGYPDVFAY
jgi:ribonuclease D